jgi:PhnB protein
MSSVKPVPAGYHTLTPTLVVDNSKAAIEFYKKAFGATNEELCMSPDGKCMHAEIKIGDSILMLNDEFKDFGCMSAKSLGASPQSIYMYVENVDQTFENAVKAGATVTMPLTDQFWGDRYGQVQDPFGHKWSIASRVENLTKEELEQRQKECFKQPAGAKK